MHRPPRHHAVSVSLLLTLAACQASQQSETASSGVAGLAFRDLRRTVEIAHDKFTALAEAMPESSLSWRPMEGVRSVAEVYMHVAADNYYVPVLMGLEAPTETGISDDVATFRAYQERPVSREEMLTALDESFELLLLAIDRTADELDREMTLGGPTTVGDVWIRAVTHLHEHLGQSIAYARSNRIVPPWSR